MDEKVLKITQINKNKQFLPNGFSPLACFIME